MLKIPTMNEWWRLSKEFPSFRNQTITLLKDFGYLEIFAHIREDHPARILEFGHGFNPGLFEFTKADPDSEVWGIDDFQNLSYFTNDRTKWMDDHKRLLADKFPNVHFVHGLLGDPQSLSGKLPENYFDLICSVSVLEEVPAEVMTKILSHCCRLLRPGGILLNTHDIRFGDRNRAREFVEAHRTAGFACDLTPAEKALLEFKSADFTQVILETPTHVMLYYQQTEGEERKYWGHFTTLVMKLRKDDCSPPQKHSHRGTGNLIKKCLGKAKDLLYPGVR